MKILVTQNGNGKKPVADALDEFRRESEKLAQAKTGIFLNVINRIEALETKIDGIYPLVGTSDQKLQALAQSISQLLAQIMVLYEKLDKRFDIFDQNLVSVRMLGEATVRTCEQLSQEFIEHNISDELYIALMRIYECLAPMGEELNQLREWISSFLENHGLRIIEPRENEKFNPAEHKVTVCTATDSRDKHGRILKVVNFGLANEKRVIEFAKVEVYKLEQERS